MTPEEIKKLSFDKAVKLEELIENVEKRILESSSELTKTVLRFFVDQLNVENGKVISAFNKRTLTLFNEAFKSYQLGTKSNLVHHIVKDINSIVDNNDSFYEATVKRTSSKTEIRKLINRRLGILENGTLLREGYMSGLLDDTAIRTQIQKHIFKEMFKNVGHQALKNSLKTLIEGEPEKFGLFQKHYRTFSYDAYAQLNSFASKTYADKLGLTHFIYNGGIIKTSREFCIHKNGEVFSIKEAEKWKNDPTLKAIESVETYNWLIDRGGFNCRHSIDFIATDVAYVLRPELKE